MVKAGESAVITPALQAEDNRRCRAIISSPMDRCLWAFARWSSSPAECGRSGIGWCPCWRTGSFLDTVAHGSLPNKSLTTIRQTPLKMAVFPQYLENSWLIAQTAGEFGLQWRMGVHTTSCLHHGASGPHRPHVCAGEKFRVGLGSGHHVPPPAATTDGIPGRRCTLIENRPENPFGHKKKRLGHAIADKTSRCLVGAGAFRRKAVQRQCMGPPLSRTRQRIRKP